jgi:hypothetical protein
MVYNGLAFGLLMTISFGWVCIFLILICLYVWKGDFKSSYNFRPWKPFDVPEDLATKIDKEGAKWLFFIACAFLCAMITGWVYGFITGDYNDLPNILLASFVGWGLIMVAMIVVVYVYAWFAVKKNDRGKT